MDPVGIIVMLQIELSLFLDCLQNRQTIRQFE